MYMGLLSDTDEIVVAYELTIRDGDAIKSRHLRWAIFCFRQPIDHGLKQRIVNP